MTFSPADWHDRFTRQARWTLDLRQYLFKRAGCQTAKRILDVGCGTGVLVSELSDLVSAQVHGLDINRQYLKISTQQTADAFLTQADAFALPYISGIFDICFCHFLLLWVMDPAKAVAEMARVTKPGGAVLAIAEPDYGGRIDYPPELAQIGQWQQAALRSQAANPEMGRRLAGIFSGLGLNKVETGVLGGQWTAPLSPEDWESEWSVIQADLQQITQNPSIFNTIKALKNIDLSACAKGERVLFVPTFYAWGVVPE
jgi:SAM-dependent methyltransferase